jgi:glycerol uptake facilitator-like aquaporin
MSNNPPPSLNIERDSVQAAPPTQVISSPSPTSEVVQVPATVLLSPSANDIWHDFQRESRRRCIPVRARCRSWGKEVFSLRFIQAMLGEFFGMTIFLTMVTLAIVYSFPGTVSVDPNNLLNTPRIVLISTVFGLTIAVLVFALSTSSGGHLNPAVSFALLLRGAISLPRFVAYVLMQMSGACAGAAFTKSLNVDLYNAIVGPDGKQATACNRINYSLWPTGMGVWTAFGAEMFATTVLCWAVLASGDVGTLPATRRSGALNPLSIGLAVFLAHLALIPIDGTSINPVRLHFLDSSYFCINPSTNPSLNPLSHTSPFLPRRALLELLLSPTSGLTSGSSGLHPLLGLSLHV